MTPTKRNHSEVREHWGLLAVWVLVLAATGLAVFGLIVGNSTYIEIGAITAGVSALLLVLRLALVGYVGYERVVGLRIIRRDRASSRAGRWLFVCSGVVAAGLALLWAFAHLWADASFMEEPAIKGAITALRLGLVAAVAVASFFGLLLLISRRFSVFGTTSIFGVVLGVAALLVVQSVATGFQHEFERRVLGVYAHINVTRPFGITEYRRFEKWLRTVEGVTGASPFVYYPMALAPYDPEGLREGDIALASVLVKGIDPSTADQVIDVVDHLERGSGRAIELTTLRSDHKLMPKPDAPDDMLPRVIAETEDPRGADWYPSAIETWRKEKGKSVHGVDDPRDAPDDDDWGDWEDAPGEDESAKGEGLAGSDGARMDTSTLPTMFVGYTLARKMQLEEGDVIRLVDPGTTFDNSQEPQFMYYLVAGVFQAGFQEYDDHLCYVDIKELQRFKYRGEDTVSGVDLRLVEPSQAHAVGASIRAELGDRYSVFEWQKLNENLFSSIETQKQIITIILSLVIFVACFNVLSALWTMTVRRTAEIAIIMSMGGTGPQIARIFQVTGMTIGLAGSLAGVAFGLVMCSLVELYGYTLDPEVYFIEQLPVEINPTQIAWILGLALGFCFVATIPPALKAARLRPVEGLRYE
jgi:lipoprotein-releasing system permease protein